MDKRSLLAIALTFVILFVWQALFVAPRQRESAQKRMMELREKQRADSLAGIGSGAATEETLAVARVEEAAAGAPSAGASSLLAGDDTIAHARITVLTDKMSVALTSSGGEVESVTLKGFEKRDGSAVELIPEGAAGGLVLSLLRDGQWSKLSRLDFEAFIDGVPVDDSVKVVLGEGRDTAQVMFRRTGPAGEYIEKRLTFSSAPYRIMDRMRPGALA